MLIAFYVYFYMKNNTYVYIENIDKYVYVCTHIELLFSSKFEYLTKFVDVTH